MDGVLSQEEISALLSDDAGATSSCRCPVWAVCSICGYLEPFRVGGAVP